MSRKLLCCLLLSGLFLAAPASSSVILDQDFESVIIGRNMDYLEEPRDGLSIDGAMRSGEWQNYPRDNVNLGFTDKAYWFRFTLDNSAGTEKNIFLEISYPMIDSIRLYRPDGRGGFTLSETGDLLPFSHREVENVGFVFRIKQAPGVSTWYLRIETTSSFNFTPVILSEHAYFSKINRELPVIWMYYGLMLIMVVYNLFIFVSSRDTSYIFYSLFITSFILLQMCLNGYAFQYLWPNSIWWANNSLPFFISFIFVSVGLFFTSYLSVKKSSIIYYRILFFMVIIPGSILSLANLMIPYAVAIKISTVFAGIMTVFLYSMAIVFAFKGSRPAVFVIIAFGGIVLGILMYILKTYGVLPVNFFTQWSIQIGSSLVVVLLSLGLADKINMMRRDLVGLLDEQRENEKTAQERARYLEGIVETVNGITGDFINVSRELGGISSTFSQLSMEQASTSEELSATFDELVASIEQIHLSTVNQQSEGEKSKKLVAGLNEAQKTLIRESVKVAKSVEEISRSARATEESLRSMTERMSVINAGGKEISQLVMMIDDISDKINLLSLNAAIEAARAGDYGRGFAVVADEIGKLAQATSDNSKSIAGRVKSIITDIDEGTGLVGSTRESTDVIFSMVGTISSGIDAVRELMVEQNGALEMVVKQTDVIETRSREVVVSTQEQKNSMVQSMHTVERLAEMAQEIAAANRRIMDFVGSIVTNSKKLADLVDGVE